MPPIDLVVFDLDGTLIDPHKKAPVRPRVRASIRAALEAGVQVTLATGRTMPFARPVAHELGLSNYLITSQGAVVAHSHREEVLWRQTLPESSREPVLQWCRGQQRIIALYEEHDGELRIWQNLEGDEVTTYDHLFGPQRRLDPDLRAPGPLLKFIVMNEPPMTPQERAQFEPEVVITRTHPRLLEGTAAGVDKGQGLRVLLNALKIPAQRVLAVGDNDNDLPLFEVAGHSVAMADSPDRVKAQADWVAPSIEEDGAAVALERYLNNP